MVSLAMLSLVQVICLLLREVSLVQEICGLLSDAFTVTGNMWSP